MKRKQAVRPIRRGSHADVRPLETAAAPARAYPDAKTLASAFRDAAMRAMRVVAIPAIGLAAGCSEVATPLPISPLPMVEIGKVVEGLKPPVPVTQIVPLGPTELPVQVTSPPPPRPPVVPVRPHETPPRPAGDMPAVVPDPDPPMIDGEAPSVQVVPIETPPPCPLPTIDDDPPMLRGRVSNVRPSHPRPVAVPGGIRSTGPVTQADPVPAPVPRTLSDEALASALASIR